MYFNIWPEEPTENFSWAICKNPESIFMREMGKEGRRIAGWFSVDEKTGRQSYHGSAVNAPLSFLATAKKLNLPAYVHNHMTSVCPYNLKAFDEILRSVMRGRNASGGHLTDEQFSEKRMWGAYMGPYTVDHEYASSSFSQVGISCVDTIGLPGGTHMYSLNSIEPMSITEFLQKVYVVSFYLSFNRDSIYSMGEEQVVKFINLCKEWIMDCPIKNMIVNKICRYNKNLIKLFETGLIEGIEDEDLRGEIAKKIDERFTRIGLHQKRHDLVLELMKNLHADGKFNTFVDLGFSEGKLLYALREQEEFNSVRAVGIELEEYRVRKARKKMRNTNTKLIQCDAMFPNITEVDVNPDVLACVEFIEHFDSEDRRNLVSIIRDVFQPKHLVLTTPNVAYNDIIGLEEGIWRHRDHKIEFNYDEFVAEVVIPLAKKYTVEMRLLVPEEEIQPSFCLVCTRVETPIKKKKKRGRGRSPVNHQTISIRKWQEMYQGIHFSRVGYTVRPNEIANGYSSRAFRMNGKNIFYLAPTISPCDWTEGAPDFLEHPLSCFEYYRNRGVTKLIGEEKYMGSRGYILCFKNPEDAKAAGYRLPLVINSRGGFPFFTDDATLMAIWEELAPAMKFDFMVLDAEIMPWNLKAGKMIDRQFRQPGECAFLSRSYASGTSLEVPSDYTQSSVDFLETVDTYAADSRLEIRPFHVLAYGSCDQHPKGLRFRDVVNGFFMDHGKHLELIQDISNTKGDASFIKHCVGHVVYLQEPKSVADSIERWMKYCDNEVGEGFVYKPMDFMRYSANGYYIQPAVKVRGKRYLQIVYGIDYLQPDYFEQLKRRGTKKKRVLAAQEFDVSLNMLTAFLRRDPVMLKRYTAAFIGMESVNMRGIDATL